jgi:O-antigen/teichoic acid export membrane protein
MDRSTRIVVNTVASYARIAVAAGAGFFTLPLALRSLGATDFGIFSVIAGSLTALLFINGALTGGAQRHMAFSLGEGSTEEAGQWFSASLMIHGFLALGVLVCALLLSHWVVFHLLSLPLARLGAAMWTYRVVVVLLFMSIISTPYQALLMAKESFAAMYLMAMAGSLFMIVGVVSLKVLQGDRLIWYAAINAVSDAFVLIGPVFYCLVRYAECRQISFVDRTRILKLLSFSSWNLLGTLSVQIRYQGPALLFNRFFGTVTNAANGIAMQVNGFGSSVSTGLLTATSPAIVKAEASGDRSEMLLLSNLSNKYAFVLLWLFIGPVLFEMTYCLRLWLHEMPADTVILSTILLIILLIDMLTAGFRASVQAEGRIALYQAVIGILLCISVPVGYLLLRLHMPASSVLWATAGGSVLAGAGRLWFLCKRIGLKASDWVNGVFRPCFVTSVACCLAMAAVRIFLKPGVLRLASLYLLNSGIVIILTWAFASSYAERTLLRMYVSRLQEVLSGRPVPFVFATRGHQAASRTAPVQMNLDKVMEGERPQPALSEKVSILMLTHNAPRYVELSIRSLVRYTRDVNYELVVVDNASESPTKHLLKSLQREGLIQHLTLLEYNSFFAKGNNIAAQNTASDSTHFLLLNSDVEIKDPHWLANLLMTHKPGITAYGVTAHGATENPLRVDGYCLLVDSALYREKGGLDEAHEFFWSVTKFQAALLAQGYSVQGYAEHERYLHHFGGKSGKDFKTAKGLFLSPGELAQCFQGRTIRVLDPRADGSIPRLPRKNILHRGVARVQRMFA